MSANAEGQKTVSETNETSVPKPASGSGDLVARSRTAAQFFEQVASVVEHRGNFVRRSTQRGVQVLQEGAWRSSRAWPKRRFRSPLAVSAVLCVVIPTLLAAIYFSVVASSQYVSEVRMSIRSFESGKGQDLLGAITGLPHLGSSTSDLYLVLNYLHSPKVVDELDQRLNLRAMYSREEIDRFSRLPADATKDDVVLYWQKMVGAGVDPVAGVLTVEVRAFSPEDAKSIAAEVVRFSEDLVNEMSSRARSDAVRFAEGELKRAEQNLTQVRTEVGAYRDKIGILDPMKTAEVTIAAIARLQDEKLKMEQELSTRRTTQGANAPIVRNLQARVETVNSQIAELQARLTSQRQQTDPALSQVAMRFEELQTQQGFAQKAYEMSLANLEKARAEAARQHLFLVPFVQPTLAEAEKYPRRVLSIFLSFLGAAMLWGIGLLIVAGVRDHML
ncbi:hypothetical protein [Microvirga sp. TS319]|uniref:hypothetical protein n=1 Tax=Microvirga sp. TS319 TaxID=3241165 RepID=UPI00351A6D55